MSWTKDDVRDEMDEQEDEEEEILWIDKKGKIVEGAFCAWFLQKHPLMCLDQKLFDLDGRSTRSGCATRSTKRSGQLPATTPPKRPNGLWRPSRWKPTRRNGTFSWTVFT